MGERHRGMPGLGSRSQWQGLAFGQGANRAEQATEQQGRQGDGEAGGRSQGLIQTLLILKLAKRLKSSRAEPGATVSGTSAAQFYG